jgi:hypothetical protein
METGSKLEDLRSIVEKVEQKANVPADDPDVVALKHIVADKISKLESQDDLRHDNSQ